ncbi:MAG: hypothetical protein M9887_06190 [Chitinophagales bacterium]|nr:hypothetical protein [Chitinophagales bacterium]
MKKIIFSVFVTLLSLGIANAQAIEKGDFLLQPSLNLGGYGTYSSGFGIGVTLNGEYAVHDYVSVGAFFGFNSHTGNSDIRFSRIGFGARGVFHFWQLIDDKVSKDLKSDKIDFYLPVHLGYDLYRWSGYKNYQGWTKPANSGQFRIGSGLGLRYYFAPKFAIALEVGGMEVSPAKIGVTIKL